VEQLKAALLLVGIAENTDENRRRLEVTSQVHVVDRDQAGFADVKFAADGLADFALQKFAHALESKGCHGKSKWVMECWSAGVLGKPIAPILHHSVCFPLFIISPRSSRSCNIQ